MALRIRYGFTTGSLLGCSIERLSAGTFYDFSTGAFSATPTTPISGLTERSSPFLGEYVGHMGTTPVGTFPDGNYAITIHNTGQNNIVLDVLSTLMYNGDDSYVFPGTGVGGAPSAAQNAAAVWNALLADYNSANTFGARINSLTESGIAFASATRILISPNNKLYTGTDGSVSGIGTGSSTVNLDVNSIVSGVWGSTLTAYTGMQAGRVLLGLSGITLGTIADAVWDEVRAGHTNAGTFGFYLDAPITTVGGSGGGGNLWSTELPGAYTSGQAGWIVGNRLDVAVSTVVQPARPNWVAQNVGVIRYRIG